MAKIVQLLTGASFSASLPVDKQLYTNTHFDPSHKNYQNTNP